MAQPQLSPRTRFILERTGRGATLPAGYLYRTDAAGTTVLPALLLMQPGASGADLRDLGVRIGTRAGAVWTAAIPVQALQQVATLKSIRYVELDEPLLQTLESARRTTRVDSAQAGYGLPKGFSGTGVVLGVLDVGFDYTHPTLRDTAGTRYRVRRIWEQKATTGQAPAAFGYGRELTDTALMLTAVTDNAGQSHGSHVAGIAAGSGRGAGDTTNRRYRGVAYGADVVLVGITPAQSDWTNTGMSDIINGMKYVYDYAASVGKPAVVNLSWGCPVGPHDGRSLFSQACNALTGPGRLFVLSGGNNGDNAIHLRKAFTAADTLLRTQFTFPTTPAGKRSWVDAWGDSAQNLAVRLDLWDSTGARSDSSAWITLGSPAQTIRLRGVKGDTLTALVDASVAVFNGKPRILLELESRTADRLRISWRAQSGTAHVWAGYVYGSSGYYGSFGSALPGTTAGNSDYTVSDMVTTRSALAVAAYTSRVDFRNTANTLQSYSGYTSRGYLAPFSSRGPSVDGRIKPDVAGPGLVVVSAVNSADLSFASGGSNRDETATEWTDPSNGRTYRYAGLMGTSMSSPAVAGIAALLLEAAPSLTPDSLRSLLALTAIVDSKQGTLPNSNWGTGKVNAYRALQRLLQVTGIAEVVSNPQGLDLLLYPNPVTGTTTLECRSESGGAAQVTVTDASGRLVTAETWLLQRGDNARQLDWSRLPPGLYFVRLSGPDGTSVLKAQVR